MPNHLSSELSLYLRQHADNPVEWYPWGPQALERARKEDKPILVSIGYSACHWCHVMEEESFTNADVAALMNRMFINIKVDREERPDLDRLYMGAVQTISGSGGWPLNVFLTPDGRPFTGGTYFPPRPVQGRPSWTEMLQRVRHYFDHQRPKVEEQASRLLEHLAEIDQRFTGVLEPLPEESQAEKSAASAPESTRSAIENMLARADKQNGGFGGAPKFPGSMSLRFLLLNGQSNAMPEAAEHALFSLEKMDAGGIYDQLRGGFARYATDSAWRIPHFEKMLYDNALLLGLYAEAWQHQPSVRFAEVIQQSLEWLFAEMLAPEGGFYASLDADVSGEEGLFYAWTAAELNDLLGERASALQRFFGMSDQGNWEKGYNVLYRPRSFEDFAAAEGISPVEWRRELDSAIQLLLKRRGQRPSPACDQKIILGWNALMAIALYRIHGIFSASDLAAHDLEGPSALRTGAGFMLREDLLEEILLQAERCMERLGRGTPMSDAQLQGPRLHRILHGDQARFEAMLDDYALYISALIQRYGATWDTAHLDSALFWTDRVNEMFSDEQDVFYYYTRKGQSDLVQRSTDYFDNEMPSGNAVMADNLLRLGRLAGRAQYLQRAQGMLKAMADKVLDYSTSFGHWAGLMARELQGPPEIAVVGPEAHSLVRALKAIPMNGALFMVAAEPQSENPWPMLRHRGKAGETLIYLCRHEHCLAPMKTPGEVRAAYEQNL